MAKASVRFPLCSLPVLRHPPMLFSSPSFSLRVRIYEEETAGWRDARSFDSTAFLPIRQTFDSFTWEPRNPSWWLPLSPSLSPSDSNLMERVWVSGTRSVAIDASRYVPCGISLP